MQNDNLNKLAIKAGAFYIASQIIIRGLTFLTTPIYTRILTTSQYGEIRIYESWLLIAVPIMSLCLWKSVERAKYDVRDDFDAFTGSVQTLSYMSIMLFFGVSLIFKTQIQSFCNMSDMMFYIAFAHIFTYTSVLYMQRREKQKMRYKASAFITFATMVPATAISIALIYWGKINGYDDSLVELRIAGFYIPQIIGGAVVAVVLWKQGKRLINRVYWKYALKYSVPLIPEALSIQIMNQADKIMIQMLVGYEYTGIFALATTISFVIWIIEDSVWNAFLPWMYEKVSAGKSREIEKPWTVIMHGFGILSWALVALAPEIVAVLGDKEYKMAGFLVAPMVTGTLFRFFSYSYTAMQNYHKNTAYVAAGTVVVMMFNVTLNYIAITAFGYMSAAYTTAICYFILLVLQGYLEKKVTGELIIPMKKSVLISIGYFVLNILTMALYLCPWYVRYTVVAVVAATAAKYMLPQFIKVLKSIKG